MSRTRSKPMNTVIEDIVRDAGFDPYKQLKEAAEEKKVPYTTLTSFSVCDHTHPVFNAIINFCEGFDISVEDFLYEMTERKKPKKRQKVS